MGRIQSYQFGKIIIDRHLFTSDVIVYPHHVEDAWWRKEGHQLIPEDMPFLGQRPPKYLVIGQGKFACLKVMPDMKVWLNSLGIEWHAQPTDEAVQLYNKLYQNFPDQLIGAFHLTC